MKNLGKRQFGVTLIELMIVVAILGILASIAIPSYREYILESRRSEAKEALMSAQLLLEEFRISCSQYGKATSDCSTNLSMSDLGAANTSYYQFSLSGTSATSYTITATAQSDQANDKEGSTTCSPMTLNQSDQRSPAACW